MKTLSARIVLCVLAVLPLVHGVDSPRSEQVTITVSPGDLGQRFEYQALRDLDRVTITVVPAAGWTIRSSRVLDPALLGWRKTGDHVFKLIVSTPPTDREWQRADIQGTLVPVGPSGSGDPVETPEYPFSFNGRIKRLGTDEGATSDFARAPVATLTSDLPAVTPQDSGLATYTGNGTTSHDFRGSIQGSYTGIHIGIVDADTGSATPFHISTAQGTSPGGTGATVWISKHGAPNGVGGKAVGEQILLNTFADSVAATAAAAAAARTIADQKATDSATAAAALATAVGAATAAHEAADAAQATVEALVAQKVAAATAAAAAAATAAATATTAAATALETARAAIAAYEDEVRQHGTNTTAARLAKTARDRAVNAANLAAQAAQRATDLARRTAEAVTRAVANARRDSAVTAAQQHADTLKQLAIQADTAVETARHAAEVAATAAEQAEATAQRSEEEAAIAVAIRDHWLLYRADTLAHENGHARILHDHVDLLTTKLSMLQAIGWSPIQETAKRLSREYWPTCRNSLITQIRTAEATAQAAYDAANHHGAL